MIWTGTPSRERLTCGVEQGPPHLQPIFRAVRDHACDFVLITQRAPATRLPKTTHPLIAVLGDDMDCALGPAGFHGPTLRKIVARASVAAVVSSGPEVEPYLAAVSNAVLMREHVVIVETRVEQELQWVQYLRTVQPNIGVQVCTVAGGTA